MNMFEILTRTYLVAARLPAPEAERMESLCNTIGVTDRGEAVSLTTLLARASVSLAVLVRRIAAGAGALARARGSASSAVARAPCR